MVLPVVSGGLQPVRKLYEKISIRFNVAVMLFMACFMSYMLRVNMSINILGMVEPTHLNENKTQPDVPDYGPRYNWTASDQSLLLGSYFWGYLFTALPGGMLAEYFGGRSVVGFSMLSSAVLTAAVPLAASLSFWSVFAMRFLVGAAGGVVYPALHNLISRWSPPNEKGKFVAALLGGTFGTVITWPVAGLLMESLGWVWAFYVPAAVTLIFTLLWYYIVADTPAQHPRISAAEVEHIERSIGDSVSKAKRSPPFLRLMLSPPFWSLLVLHYGSLWGLYFLITAAPKFMSEVLGFSLSAAGLLASLPYLARMTFGFGFGAVGDALRANRLMSVTAIRKVFCLFSHIVPGLFLLSLGHIGTNPYWHVAIITLSLGFNGAATITNLQNSQDLSPNFAGTLYGMVNFIGSTSGFITPLIVANFTHEQNTIVEWSQLFTIGAIAYILPAIIFIVFGSGEVQSWNEPPAKQLDAEVPAATASAAAETTIPTAVGQRSGA